MDMNIIITIIGAIGGAEGLRRVITAWMNRKTNARKEDAAENENERKQLPSDY